MVSGIRRPRSESISCAVQRSGGGRVLCESCLNPPNPARVEAGYLDDVCRLWARFSIALRIHGISRALRCLLSLNPQRSESAWIADHLDGASQNHCELSFYIIVHFQVLDIIMVKDALFRRCLLWLRYIRGHYSTLLSSFIRSDRLREMSDNLVTRG